ncbi:hypothetical protein B0H11DRAFT_2222651 [Mycena galericulata]|nr:hypothetical protein B0H11DRAFT_2222651 [Mycena galericulata]
MSVGHLSLIDKSHRDIAFSSSLESAHLKHEIRDKPIPEVVSGATDPDSTSFWSADDSDAGEQLSHDDLLATQKFFAGCGRIMNLREPAYFLADEPRHLTTRRLGCNESKSTRLRSRDWHSRHAIFRTSRVVACAVLRKFEGTGGTVSQPWRGRRGGDGIIAAYAEQAAAH